MVIKRAHTEVRPYRLIMPVVLHFLLLVARLCRFHSEAEKELGRQEGIVCFSFLFGTDYTEKHGLISF